MFTRRQVRHQALQNATIHNREAAVGKLPMELLSEIFRLGLDECGPDTSLAIQHLSIISSVCSTWRGAALGTPSIWRDISYTDYDHYFWEGGPCPPDTCPIIPRQAKDRLLAYLSRSKNYGIRLHLRFGARSLRIQAVKEFLRPHLPRCHSISLRFRFATNMEDFLPLQGDLCRLTEFTCVFVYIDDEPPRPPIFAEPERVSLRRLVLENMGFHTSLNRLDVKGLEDVRLSEIFRPWFKIKDAIITPQCLSLTTLIIRDNTPFITGKTPTPFILPNLIHLDTLGFTLLKAVHTPKLKTLVLSDMNGDDSRCDFDSIPTWPALTTLCVISGNLRCEAFIGLLMLNPSIRRIIISELSNANSTTNIVRILTGYDLGGPAYDFCGALLPALRLLRICSSVTHPSRFRDLLAHRPTLRIDCGIFSPGCAEGWKRTAEAFRDEDDDDDDDGEPGIFQRVARGGNVRGLPERYI